MSKTVVFAKRDVKEILRAPTSWIFGMAMPVGILTIMQIIMNSLGEEAAQHTPMFQVDYFTGGVIVFGASFLTMFCVMLITKDRAEAFLQRLFASPMRAGNYIVGYSLSLLPLLFLQLALTFIVAMLFGLTISWNIIPAFFLGALSSLMFIGIGLLLGSILNEKSGPPICSVVVQFAALFSGMWFDLEAIGGGFEIFCKALPFANAYNVIQYALAGDFEKTLLPMLIVLSYTVLFFALAVLVFKKQMREN